MLPAAIAWIGAQIVDSVAAALMARSRGADPEIGPVLEFVVLEGLLVAALAAAQRGLSTCHSLLRAMLGQRVNVMILEKALTL